MVVGDRHSGQFTVSCRPPYPYATRGAIACCIWGCCMWRIPWMYACCWNEYIIFFICFRNWMIKLGWTWPPALYLDYSMIITSIRTCLCICCLAGRGGPAGGPPFIWWGWAAIWIGPIGCIIYPPIPCNYSSLPLPFLLLTILGPGTAGCPPIPIIPIIILLWTSIWFCTGCCCGAPTGPPFPPPKIFTNLHHHRKKNLDIVLEIRFFKQKSYRLNIITIDTWVHHMHRWHTTSSSSSIIVTQSNLQWHNYNYHNGINTSAFTSYSTLFAQPTQVGNYGRNRKKQLSVL